MSTLYNIGKSIGGFIITTYSSDNGGSITNSEKARKSWIEWHFTEDEVPQLQVTITYPDGEPVVYTIPFEQLTIDSFKYIEQNLISEVLTNFLNSTLVQLNDLENIRIIEPSDGQVLMYNGDLDLWHNSSKF